MEAAIGAEMHVEMVTGLTNRIGTVLYAEMKTE